MNTGDVLVNRYRLEEELGRGGMGIVFAAFDMVLRRRVAIKFILASDPSGLELARFMREAVGLASLRQYPNILTIYDVVENWDPPFLVTELLKGSTLAFTSARAPLSVANAVRIAVQIAKGLAGAHGQQLIHRDLTPGNIFIVEDGQVKLIDFGIAKPAVELSRSGSDSIDTPGEASSRHTAKGMIPGTRGYTAPELIREEKIDHRADIFSFGAVLYEMLAGRQAFVANAERDVYEVIRCEEPPPLPRAVPAALRQIVERCLRKEAGQRYETAAALQRELELVRESLTKPGRRSLWRPAAVTIACLLIAFLIYRYFHDPSGSGIPETSAGLGPSIAARQSIVIEEMKGDPATAAAGGIIATGLKRGLSTIPGLDVRGPGKAADELWLLKSQISQQGKSLRLTMQFETPHGQRAGRAVEVEGSVKKMLESSADLGFAMRAELMPLWNDHLRRGRAREMTRSAEAKAKLDSYYDLPGAATGSHHGDVGRRLLEEALAADPEYVPALVEKSRMAVAAAASSAEPLVNLREATEALEKAVALAPVDPEVLLERCRAAWGEAFYAPTEERIKRAISACSDATRSERQSATAFYALAQLYDHDCDDGKLIEALKSAIESAKSHDPPRMNMINLSRISVALQRGQWDEARLASAALLQAEADAERLRSLIQGSLNGFDPLPQVHFLRAATLVRLKEYGEAEKEFEAELKRDSNEVGGIRDKVEAACLRGLSSLAARRGQSLSARRTDRLKELENMLGSSEVHGESAPLEGYYGLADPEAGVAWIERQKPPADCTSAMRQALIYRDAGHLEQAARVLEICHPADQWSKRCLRRIQSPIGLPR